MEYTEFKIYKQINGPEYPLVNAYADDDGNILVVEPSFYYGLQSVRLRREDIIPDIMAKIDELLKANKKLVLTADFEQPFFISDSFVYKELSDILDSLNIYFEDKSRGSDYGD